jgi:Na+-transporting methylmalonyl-CoA/oxaloacetate decarboxylase gamma subunit
MKDWAFGLTMTVMGMGVTLITLYLLTLLIRLLIKLFPRLIQGKGHMEIGYSTIFLSNGH